MKKNYIRGSLLIALLQLTVACATTRSGTGSHETPEATEKDASKDLETAEETADGQTQQQIDTLNEKIQVLESKIDGLNQKLDAARKNQESARHKAIPTAVIPNPASISPDIASAKKAPHDPDQGFINDDAVQNFRKAMIIFEGQKYPEAVLAFSGFLNRYPDHPLAGSAQFYIGKCYSIQKEYKLALQEYQRVLTAYDRSTHISDTLNEMVLAEENLKRTDFAIKFRQTLTSLFPHSPAAARNFGREPEIAKPMTPPVESAPEPRLEAPANSQQQAPLPGSGDGHSGLDQPTGATSLIPPTAPMGGGENSENPPPVGEPAVLKLTPVNPPSE